MTDRHHRAPVNSFVWLWQDLIAVALGTQPKSGTARPTHAKRSPVDPGFETVILPQEQRENLVRTRSLPRASRDGENSVGMGTIGHDGCLSLESHAISALL